MVSNHDLRPNHLSASEPNVHCYTSFNFAYLSRANILANSLKAVHPEWALWAVIVDVPRPGLDLDKIAPNFDYIVFARDLPIEDFNRWIFKHDVVEACTAVKGEMLCHILRHGASKVLYFDPDIAIFNRIDSIVSQLDNCSIVITPHQINPSDSSREFVDNEYTSMNYGIYNLGFLAVNNDNIGRKFADWWSRRLYDACYDQPSRGIFTDQKYIDLVPALFDRVSIDRDPGLNVASWNINHRRAWFDSQGRININDGILKFYHFTKINSEGDAMTVRYAKDNYEILEIWNWYKREVKRLANVFVDSLEWPYGQYSNGMKIPKSHRERFRYTSDLYARFGSPFESGVGSYFDFIQESSGKE